jgi:hypothetical protein
VFCFICCSENIFSEQQCNTPHVSSHTTHLSMHKAVQHVVCGVKVAVVQQRVHIAACTLRIEPHLQINQVMHVVPAVGLLLHGDAATVAESERHLVVCAISHLLHRCTQSGIQRKTVDLKLVRHNTRHGNTSHESVLIDCNYFQIKVDI